MLCLNLTDIVFITLKGVDCCVIHGITKSDAIHLLQNFWLDDRRYMKNAYQKNKY